MRGNFITLEGADGSGKSSFCRRMEKELSDLGIQYVTTREPGGTVISERIRSILLDRAHAEMSPRAEALLYAASRAQHVEEVIRPALEAGKLVLCERYVLSSVAYQGYGRELGEEPVTMINTFATDGLVPDLTLFFSVDPKQTLARKALAADRLEEEGAAFHGRVYEGYVRAAASYPGRVITIDATRSEEDVFQAGKEVLLSHIRGSENR